jgi:peptidoglycan hydrolase-like protein with peptidoglycan-binding domain
MMDLNKRAVDMALAMVEATYGAVAGRRTHSRSSAGRAAGGVTSNKPRVKYVAAPRGKLSVRPAAGSSWGTANMRGQRLARRSRRATARAGTSGANRKVSSGTKRGWSDEARAASIASRRKGGSGSSGGGGGGWKPKAVGNLPNGKALRKRHFGGSPSATKSYQRRYGLQVDGVVGRQTMSAVKRFGTKYGSRPPGALKRIRSYSS